jgi:hypothetical protein
LLNLAAKSNPIRYTARSVFPRQKNKVEPPKIFAFSDKHALTKFFAARHALAFAWAVAKRADNG